MNLRQNQQNEVQALQEGHTIADWDSVPERVSETEMRAVMELYDTQSGLGPSKTETTNPTTAAPQTADQVMPTISDVAEILGISNTEAQRLLGEVRARKEAEAAQQQQQQQRLPPLPPQARQQTYTQTNTPPQTMGQTMGQTTVQLQAGQQVTVVQNVIVDSHAYLFEKFNANNGGFVSTWNWGAFLFGPLWYFYKGMWAKGLLYWIAGFISVAFTAGFSGLLFPVLLALMANYDYYLLRCHQTQMWDKKRGMMMPTTIIHTSAAASQGQGQYHPAQTFRPSPPPPLPVAQPIQTAQTPTATTTEAVSPAGKFQVLREAYERGLVTRAEYEEKRLVLLRELENQDNLKKLDEAHRLGILTTEELEAKRHQLLNG